jgi:integrase
LRHRREHADAAKAAASLTATPGWLPKAPRADTIAKEALLPSEEARLLRGETTGGGDPVPLAYQAVYLLMHREGMRKGEVQQLTWADLDLKRGMVSLDENKTDRPRSSGLRRRRGEGPRRLRAFFITSGMFAGRDALWITDRSGHTTLSMLRTYERDVRRWRELGESPVDAASAIPEFAAAFTAAERGGNSASPEVDESVSTRDHIAKAEVAEWQTQRTQNPPSERA